jgi:ATP-dependent Clp protease, protease subunit
VTDHINSPGGDFFDGVAIYNLLREHPKAVTVKVMGLAASAASIIAMAGDEIHMGAGTSLMIHNAWGVVVGNANDMRESADTFATFDSAMLSIYAARTGGDEKAIKKMMDAETIMSADDAVAKGFADSVVNLPTSTMQEKTKASAKKQIEALLAEKGMPRSERRKLFRELSGTQDAADDIMPRADEWPVAEMQQLLSTITG